MITREYSSPARVTVYFPDLKVIERLFKNSFRRWAGRKREGGQGGGD